MWLSISVYQSFVTGERSLLMETQMGQLEVKQSCGPKKKQSNQRAVRVKNALYS